MKNNFLYRNLLFITLAVSSLLISSCSEEIQPSTDGKSTAIIFATLDAKDSVHFVKITKAFNGSGNQLELAQIPDSSYFKNVNAVVKEYTNGSVSRTFTLKDTIITNKESGAFYAPEQKLYYFEAWGTNKLLGSESVRYQLEVDINNGEFKVTSDRIELVYGLAFNTPSVQSEIKFEKESGKEVYKSESFKFNVGNSQKMEAKLYIDFEEYNEVAGVENLKYSKSIEWKIDEKDADGIPTGGLVSTSVNGQLFFELVKDNASSDGDIVKRKFKGMKVLLNGASADLQKYLLLNKPSSSLSQSNTAYTNLTVTNGHRVVGIFASRSQIEIYRPAFTFAGGGSYYACLNTNSMKELCKGNITGFLAFCSSNPTHSTQNYFCN